MSDLIAISGQNGTLTVSSAVLVLIYVQAALVALSLLAFLFLMLRKFFLKSGRQDIVVCRTVTSLGGRPLSISVDPSKAKQKFAVGDRFEHFGLVVTAAFEDGDRQVDSFTVDPPDMDSAGVKAVVVRYEGCSAVYHVEVEQAAMERFPIALTLDATAARRQFAVGEAFDVGGLRVYMEYNIEPYTVETYDFAVEAPDMYSAGEKYVYVRCGGFVESYVITVTDGEAQPYDYDEEPYDEESYDASYNEATYDDIAWDGTADVAEDVAAEEISAPAEVADDTVLRLDRSFIARLAQSSDLTKSYYSTIKNELLSYENVKSRVSWKRETYKIDGAQVAKLSFRGDTLCLSLPLDPAEYAGTRYKVEDMSSNKSGEETPCMLRIKNEKRLRLSFDLIARVMQERGADRTETASVDYFEPYRSDEQLLRAGLIRREFKSKQEENSVFAKGKASTED